MSKFANKYRIESHRASNWDYASSANYFITLCCEHHQHFFGEIREGKMFLNEIGQIAKDEWIKSPEIRPDMNLSLKEFTFMPNHFHAIIFIGNNEFNIRRHKLQNSFGPQRKNLSSLIRGFKSSVTVKSRKINPLFTWQSNYHDHIIRNETEFHAISNYIKSNAKNWQKDKFNS